MFTSRHKKQKSLNTGSKGDLSVGAINELTDESRIIEEEEYANINETEESILFENFDHLKTNVGIMENTILRECQLLLGSIKREYIIDKDLESIIKNINLAKQHIKGNIEFINQVFSNICVVWLNEFSFLQKPNTIQLAYIINPPYMQLPSVSKNFSKKLIQLTNRRQKSTMVIQLENRLDEFSVKRKGAFSYGLEYGMPMGRSIEKGVKSFLNQTQNIHGNSVDITQRYEIINMGTRENKHLFELNLIAEILLKNIFENYDFSKLISQYDDLRRSTDSTNPLHPEFIFSNLPFSNIDRLYYFPGSAVNMVTTEIYKFNSQRQQGFEDFKSQLLLNGNVYGMLSTLGKPQNKILRFDRFGEIPVIVPDLNTIETLHQIERYVGKQYYPSMLCRKLYEILKVTPVLNISDYRLIFLEKIDYVLSRSYIDEYNAKIENASFTLEDFLSIFIDGIYSLFTPSENSRYTLDSMLVYLIYILNQYKYFCIQCGGGGFKVVADIGKKSDNDSRLYVIIDDVDGDETLDSAVNIVKEEFKKLIYFLEQNKYYQNTFLLHLGNYWIEIKKKDIRYREHTPQSGFPAHLLSIDIVYNVCIKHNTHENIPGSVICNFEHYSSVFDIVIKSIFKDKLEYYLKSKMVFDESESISKPLVNVNNYLIESQDQIKSSDLMAVSEPHNLNYVYIMNLLGLFKTILETFESQLNLYNRALQGKLKKDTERIGQTLVQFEKSYKIDISSIRQILVELDNYIDENITNIPKEMLSTSEKIVVVEDLTQDKQIEILNTHNGSFIGIINRLLIQLKQFIYFCEEKKLYSPRPITEKYVEVGFYEHNIDIDRILIYFVTKVIKGVEYTTYIAFEPGKVVEDSKVEKKKKIKDTISRARDKRNETLSERRGLKSVGISKPDGTKKTKKPVIKSKVPPGKTSKVLRDKTSKVPRGKTSKVSKKKDIEMSGIESSKDRLSKDSADSFETIDSSAKSDNSSAI